MSALKMGELFAGYGGLGMGVSAVLDAELAWVSEFDKGPSKILAHRFPDVPNHGDITKIDWSQVEPVDVLTGGSPCQDLSHAGRRAGMTEGTRSNLWVAMREAIAQLKPSLVVWENVGGAFSAAADSEVEPCAGCVGDGSGVNLRALGRVLGDLSSLGFDAEWVAVRAADVGAPHGRLRVFVTAYPAHPEHAQLERVGQLSGLRGGPDARADLRVSAPASLSLLPTPAVNDMGASYTPDEWDAWTDRMKAEHGNGNGHGKSLHIEAARLLPTPKARDHQEEGYEAGLRHQVPQVGTLARAGVEGRIEWGQYDAAIHRWETLTRPAPAPTETGPKGNPRLSAAFSEWMMGLPAGWVTDVPGITRNEALKALGNGVCPQQAAAALRVLLGASERAA